MNKQSISGLTKALTTGFAILALSLTTLSLSSCSSSDDDEILEDLSEDSVEDMLIGTWSCIDGYMIFEYYDQSGEQVLKQTETYTGNVWTIEEDGSVIWSNSSDSETFYWAVKDGQFLLGDTPELVAIGDAYYFDITVTSSTLSLLYSVTIGDTDSGYVDWFWLMSFKKQ